jgi:dihydropteroate synthase-like protein
MSDSHTKHSDPHRRDSEKILFVTGRLAEVSLKEVVAEVAGRTGFDYQIVVPGIQVAALLHTSLLQKRLTVPEEIDRVVLPGWAQGDISDLELQFGKPFERGPKHLHDLPAYFGLGKRKAVDLTRYSIDIIAEINHATRQPLESVLAEARMLVASGANMIDIGCVPGETGLRVGETVAALVAEDISVSIDSFDRHEVEQAVENGATLILSCNQSNLAWITDLETEVVVIPDSPQDLDSLDRTVNELCRRGTPFRIDPIIEPVGMGFTASLQRYIDVRRRFPDSAMMMGVGNVTELAEVDSAGINLLLAAICEELGIQSVLTTQVINWCRSAVAEFDAARRIVRHAVTNQVVAKHLDSSLVMLRDPRINSASVDSLNAMADALTDSNFRIFAEQSGLHLMNRHGHWQGTDGFELFRQATQQAGNTVDSGHAFYLGYEMARAEIARHLGKQYLQDEPLQWGLLGESSPSSSVHDRKCE